MSETQRRGIPLSAVFLLMATVAVVMALVHSSLQKHTLDERYRPQFNWAGIPIETDSLPNGTVWVDRNNVLDAAISTGLIGGLVGVVFGLGCPRRILGVCVAIPGGVMAGAAAGFLVVCPPDVSMVLIACGILVATGATIRLSSR